MWHGGGLDKAGRNARLPALDRPCRRRSNWARPSASTRGPEDVPRDGPGARPARPLRVRSERPIASPSPINYPRGAPESRRSAGVTSRRRATPSCGPPSHRASLSAPDDLRHGDPRGFRAIERSGRIRSARRYRVRSGLGPRPQRARSRPSATTRFHTSPEALRNGEAHISAIRDAPRSGRPSVKTRFAPGSFV